MAKKAESKQPEVDKNSPIFNIQRIYIKDVSFETPNAPKIFKEEWKPEVNVDLHTKTNDLEPDVYDVVLHLTVTVKMGTSTAFLVEVHQAGIFTIKGFPKEQLSHALGSMCPNILYPYAREAISDLVTRGGFPQLLLAPVNFDALYMQHLEQQKKEWRCQRMMKNFSRQSKICVLGAGSWGTALALYFATRFESVNLWSFDPKEAAKLQEVRENVDYLPGIPFPPNIDCLHNLSQAITENCVVVVAVPSHAFEETVAQLEPLKQQMVSVVIATKGVTQKGEFLHHQTQQVLGDFPIALLSGPSFAKEVALGMPSSLTLASEYPALLKQLKPMFHSEIFRIETTEDCVGVALGGLVKNVIAIAVGLSDGLGYGANARAALITRGVQEMQSITKAMSGQTKTVMGLAALGDLVLTTTDNQSRNRRFGLALGQGMSVAEAETHIGQVVEGKTNVKELMMLAKRYQLSLPICQQIFELICQGVPAQTVMKNILSV